MRTTSNQNYACLEWKWWALRENPTAFNFSQWHTFWQLVTVPKFQTRSKIVVLWSILCSTRGRKFSSSSFTLCREKSQIEVKQDGTQKQTKKKKSPSFSKPLGPQRLLYFASKTSLGYKRLFHDFSESVGSIPKFLMHAPCYNEPKDISTAFQTKQMLEKSSGQYLGVLIRFRDEPWWKTPSCKISQCYPRFECMPQVVRNLKI